MASTPILNRVKGRPMLLSVKRLNLSSRSSMARCSAADGCLGIMVPVAKGCQINLGSIFAASVAILQFTTDELSIMSVMPASPAHIEQIYRDHSRRVLATLIRLLNDFNLAEECLQEAFIAALRQWPQNGIPDNPTTWLISTGHRRGIDQIRRNQTVRRHAHLVESDDPSTVEADETPIDDDLLRLLFTCCHPALAMEARVALTLREMCGLTTEQVARALLQKPTTLAQRIVRAKKKIREARIPYEVPEPRQLPERLPGVLRVIYLVFNEGYSRSDGESVTDMSLSDEAIRLTENLTGLLPEGEVFGLLALMLLHDSRRGAREDENGNLVTVE